MSETESEGYQDAVPGFRFREYQAQAARTANLPGDGDEDGLLRALSCCGLGLAGELGEVADLLKKVIHHGKPLTPGVRAKIHEELGDALWYVAYTCSCLGFDMDDVALANIEKLRKRYPHGFTEKDAEARVDVPAPVPEPAPAPCPHCGRTDGSLHCLGFDTGSPP